MDNSMRDEPKLIWVLCFILFFSVMNISMFNVALPNIANDFGLIPSEVSWVVTGYTVIYALGAVIYGKLADRYPLRRLITIGISLFSVGSCIGFFAESYAVLLAGRILQSAGASAVPALSMLIPARFVPQEKRGRALGTIASTIAFAAGIGPIVGGVMAGSLSWNYLFIVSMGTLLALPMFLRWLPKEETRAGSFDAIGGMLLGGAVITLLLTITNFQWWLPVLSFALFIAFGFWITKTSMPFIQPKLFRNAAYTASLTIMFLTGSAGFGVLIVMPLLLSNMNGLSAAEIGLAMFPAAMGGALLGRYGGRLADQKGNGIVVGVGLTIILSGLFLLSFTAGHSVWTVGASFVFVNVGYSFMQAAITNHVSVLLPREQTGIGMGTLMLTSFLSSSIIGAVATKSLDHSSGSPALNPFADAAASGYSNVFTGLALLTIINLIIVYRFIYKKRSSLQSPKSL